MNFFLVLKVSKGLLKGNAFLDLTIFGIRAIIVVPEGKKGAKVLRKARMCLFFQEVKKIKNEKEAFTKTVKCDIKEVCKPSCFKNSVSISALRILYSIKKYFNLTNKKEKFWASHGMLHLFCLVILFNNFLEGLKQFSQDSSLNTKSGRKNAYKLHFSICGMQ